MLVKFGTTALIRCVDFGRYEMYRVLIEAGVNPTFNAHSSEVLIVAASRLDDTRILKDLMSDERIDPSVNDNMCLANATLYGRLEAMRILLADPRVDASARDGLAILLPAYRKDKEAVEILAETGRFSDHVVREARRMVSSTDVKLII